MAGFLRAILCAGLVLFAARSSARAQTQQQRLNGARRALDYLAKTQRPQGYWSTTEYRDRVRLTAIAGYALACEGTTPVQGWYCKSLRRAVDLLLNLADRRRGLIWYKRDPHLMYGHGLSMSFFATLSGDVEDQDRLKDIQVLLQNAVQFSAAMQLANGGWAEDIELTQPEFARAFVTATQLLGLFACRRAGIAVPQETIDKGLRFLIARQRKDGGIAERPGEKQPSHPVSSAATLLCLLQAEAELKSASRRVTAKQRRVLLLAGGPTRDYRCVSRMLHANARFRVDAWLQTVDPKAGKEVVQPVDALLTAFPKASDLSKYEAVIAFDPDWTKLKPADTTALDEWVRKRGGGLVLWAADVFTRSLKHRRDVKRIARLYPGVVIDDTFTFTFDHPPRTPANVQWENVKPAPVGIPKKMLADHFHPVHGFYIARARDGVNVFARFIETSKAKPLSRILFSSHTAGKGRVFYCGTSETWRLRGTRGRHFEQLWYGVLRHVVPTFPRVLPKPDPLVIDAKTARGKAITRLQAYCDRVFAPKSQARVEHRSLAELYYAQTARLQPKPSRSKAVAAIVKRLQDTQSADGTWKSQSKDPLREAASAAILLLSERVLPFHDR